MEEIFDCINVMNCIDVIVIRIDNSPFFGFFFSVFSPPMYGSHENFIMIQRYHDQRMTSTIHIPRVAKGETIPIMVIGCIEIKRITSSNLISILLHFLFLEIIFFQRSLHVLYFLSLN